MTNVFSLCNDIEEFLQKTDENSKNQFLHWIKYRLNISNKNKNSMINTSQIFICKCGHRYSLRFVIDDLNQNNNDELQSLEQLIPPESIEQQESNIIGENFIGNHHLSAINDSLLSENERMNSSGITHFGLPKLTDSIVEIIHSDGKRQFRCPLCFNSYVNRSGLNRHYITHSSQDLWKVECQFCGKRYSRKDSLKHHIKTQHAQFVMSNWTWKNKTDERIFQSYKNLLDTEFISSTTNEKEQMENDDIVLIT